MRRILILTASIEEVSTIKVGVRVLRGALERFRKAFKSSLRLSRPVERASPVDENLRRRLVLLSERRVCPDDDVEVVRSLAGFRPCRPCLVIIRRKLPAAFERFG